MTISEIRDILKQGTVEKTVLEEIMADERKGARQLVDAYIRRLNRESAERFRVEDMYEPESSFYKKGLEYVAGIDEVGRGPLAGPVTVEKSSAPAAGRNCKENSRNGSGYFHCQPFSERD